MNCILKACANEGAMRCRSLGACAAAHALALSQRNDGYLVIARDNPTIDALRTSGLVTAKYVGDGCSIVRAIPVANAPRPITIGYNGQRLIHDDRRRRHSFVESAVQT